MSEKRELVLKALRGESVDRVPVGFWHHFTTEDECTPFQPGKCVFNPLKKCNYCTSGQVNFEFASALTVMMTYQKIRDDIEDSGFGGKLKAYLVLPLVAGANKKAAKKYPELKKILDETIATQSQVEKEERRPLWRQM